MRSIARVGSCEARLARGPEVGLRTLSAGDWRAGWCGRLGGQRGLAGLLQKGPNVGLRTVVVALAEMLGSNMPGRVDQVIGGPVLVAVGVPGRELVVLCDRIGDSKAGDRR